MKKELLISAATEELINSLKATYEYIILDTPPIALVSDALELLKYTDATIYVVRQGYSKKGMLKMINEKYVKQEISKVSIVLNDFNIKSKYGYGYGYGYGGYGGDSRQRNRITQVQEAPKEPEKLTADQIYEQDKDMVIFRNNYASYNYEKYETYHSSIEEKLELDIRLFLKSKRFDFDTLSKNKGKYINIVESIKDGKYIYNESKLIKDMAYISFLIEKLLNR